MTEKSAQIPSKIQQLRDETKSLWDQLPVEYQATFVLNALREILSGEYHDTMIVALKIAFADVWHAIEDDNISGDDNT